MFFDDEGQINFNPELFQGVHQGFYAINSDMEISRYGLRSVPTHTEDGIPIRKLYVSNLPPKTTRTELFGVFAQYGFIKSCWLRMGEKGPTKALSPTYAFVTFSNPADAHKALQAPNHEKTLRGRPLRISPADSWHQPAEDADGQVRWKSRCQRSDAPENQQGLGIEQIDVAALPVAETSTDSSEATNSDEFTLSAGVQTLHKPEESIEEDMEYNMLDILNQDCLTHILSFVPMHDLIRSERTSKRWQNMIHEYLQGVRIFKTSWWQHGTVTLTTAILRRVLQRFGSSLVRLDIDHHWSALNDRTAHTVGKFCPNLEELKVVGMHTRNWNPLIYGCKELKNLSFISCNKLTDSSLVHLVKKESCIESLTVANNTHVTGLFLTGSSPSRLSSLAFYNCYSLQGTVLCAAIETLPSLTTLKLDIGPPSLWKIIPLILKKMTKLEELSLSEYTSSMETTFTPQGTEMFCEAIACLTELKTLNLSQNVYITNAVLKQVAQSCQKLQKLNVSCCNSKNNVPSSTGVTDEGVAAICKGCTELRSLDISYLAGLTDSGAAAAASLQRLETLVARGNTAVTTAPFAKCLETCHFLEEMDLCGCDYVTEEVAEAACRALSSHPRPVALRLAGTVAAHAEEIAKHKHLSVNTTDDRCDPHLRPDFVDKLYDTSSDDSFEDIYDPEDYDDFLNSDEDLFLEDDLDEYNNALYQIQWGLRAPPDIILL